MPAFLVSSIAEKTGIPIAEAEHRWVKAKTITNDETSLNPSNGDAYWQYVTGVFKKSMGIGEDGVILESIVQPNQKPTIAQDQSKKAMKFTLDTQKNTMEGASRPDVGWIAFLWGNAGTAPLFADGDGLSRIIAKQDFEKKYLSDAPSGRDLCMRLVDIVTRGYVKRKYGPTSRPKIDFSWQGEVATVSWEPARKTWYLSAWREDWGGVLESAATETAVDEPQKQPWEMTMDEYTAHQTAIPKVYGIWNSEVGDDRYSKPINETDKIFNNVIKKKMRDVVPGAKWPFEPVLVSRGGSGPYVLVDGHHRIELAKRLGIRIIPAELTDQRAFGNTTPVNTYVEIGADGTPKIVQPNNESLPRIKVTVPENNSIKKKTDYSKEHRNAVESAIAEGKRVPDEVIKDYPEFLPVPEKQPWEMTKKEIIQSSLRLSYDEFGDQAVSRLNYQRISSGRPSMKEADERSLRVQATITSRARFTEPIMAAKTIQDIADVFGQVFDVRLDDGPVMESAATGYADAIRAAKSFTDIETVFRNEFGTDIPGKVTQKTDHGGLTGKEYDRLFNEGGDGYNPIREARKKAEFDTNRSMPKTFAERKDALLRQIEINSGSLAREFGTYSQAKIDGLNAQIKELDAKEIEAFLSVWTLEETKARRSIWNDRVKSGEFNNRQGKIDPPTLYKAYAKQGWILDDLKRAIKMHSL